MQDLPPKIQVRRPCFFYGLDLTSPDTDETALCLQPHIFPLNIWAKHCATWKRTPGMPIRN
jgi:hypothetical protein